MKITVRAGGATFYEIMTTSHQTWRDKYKPTLDKRMQDDRYELDVDNPQIDDETPATARLRDRPLTLW